MGIDLEAPDHTTLSRRTQHLDVELAGVASSRPIHLIVDSTGLTIAGEGEKDSGYHQQARVENTFFRYKTIIGDRLRARHPESQRREAPIACNILNRMAALGPPESFAIGSG